MVARTRGELTLRRLGDTPQAALRVLLTEFRYRGWRDPDVAALSIIRALDAAAGELTAVQAAAAVPSSFLLQNRISRRDLELMLKQLIQRRS
jgi:hypothetical protein